MVTVTKKLKVKDFGRSGGNVPIGERGRAQTLNPRTDTKEGRLQQEVDRIRLQRNIELAAQAPKQQVTQTTETKADIKTVPPQPVVPQREELETESERLRKKTVTSVPGIGEVKVPQGVGLTTPEGQVKSPFSIVGTVGGALAPTAFDLFDNLRATVTGGDTVDVKGARGTFTQATTSIGNDIKDVQLGRLAPSVALQNINLAINANNRLEAASKEKGLSNLRYWLRSGKDLDADIALNKRELDRLLQQLELAIQAPDLQAQAIAQAQQELGVT